MTPVELIESLGRHYAKRHESVQAQSLWLTEMVAIAKGADPRVIQRAYEMIRDDHDERAFPLPATIKKYLMRAAEAVYPEDRRGMQETTYRGPSHRMPDSPQQLEIYRKAQEWQAEQIRRYGSWDAQWRATRHTHVRKGGKVRLPLQKKPPARFALSKLRKIRRKGQDVSRPAMELLQRVSRNRHLHVDHNALARRITGERYE